MTKLLKNIYNEAFFARFLNALKVIIPDFNSSSFLEGIYNNEWENKELKQRMRHITLVLKNHLSDDFNNNVKTIFQLIPELRKHGFLPDNFEFMFFPDFIELYGAENYETSIKAFEKITQFVSCEFAVRPFIIKHPNKMLKQMGVWSNNNHSMVRRLASEGCRPRLPWALAIPLLKENPTPIISILENLKNDTYLYVRRSVANNLNDISKDNPDIVVSIARKWIGANKEIDWLVKHACRSLLKQGNTEVMQLFGFGSVANIKVQEFVVLRHIVNIGNYLEFSFKLINTSITSTKVRIEYGLYYQKANGSLSKKVFKISETKCAKKSTTWITRKQSFKVITTRKLHIGKHQVSIIINGNEFDKIDFELKK